jgi:uncharacterized protein (DUF1330 family)
MNRVASLSLLATLGAVLWAAGRGPEPTASAAAGRVFELRTYTTNEGKLPDLHKRFRDHTCRLFRKHGMELVGFWTPQDEKDGKADTLIYILAFPSREAAKASWKAFDSDPEWHKARDESHKDGVIVKEVKRVYMDPTDYSPLQ